ncbi:MAG: BTAD domain-containing putative transcriptional regulator [Gemmatimonadota bacterium]|nr:BTAD domain-containing putative transcriptional regulator [Gemmatimonadota bacterium]
MRTLGSIEVTGLEPARGERLLAQPKRLALLAFLAARPAGERVGRDRIVAMFWPDQATDRARGNLRTAIYFLRNVLGHDVIDGRGDTVGISPRHLSCDAAILLEDFPTRPLADLLDLYRGEFLDALHLSGAPDFERWVDRKRAALRARGSEIAWRLSERAEAAGEWISAARFGRRAADLAVDLEQASQRLIELFDRAGDRGAAFAEYERLTARLAEEFDASPSPETAALIERIRERRSSETVVARAGRSREARRRRSLAVLPFENLGEEPDAHLAHGLGEDLLTALTRIRDVRVVSRTSVRDFATEPPASMRAVHDALGVDLVLEGSVPLEGDRVRIHVQLIDAEMDEHLWAQTYNRRLTDIFEIQSEVALRISRTLESELSPREHRRLRAPPRLASKPRSSTGRGSGSGRAASPKPLLEPPRSFAGLSTSRPGSRSPGSDSPTPGSSARRPGPARWTTRVAKRAPRSIGSSPTIPSWGRREPRGGSS